MPTDAFKECEWADCRVVLADGRKSWCDEHKAPGTALRRSERNARYNASRRELAASALAPDVAADGGVVLRRPVADRLRSLTARLDRAVAEYDSCVKVFVGFDIGEGMGLEGWADLRKEHEQRLRFAVTELRSAARDAADALGPVLAANTQGRR